MPIGWSLRCCLVIFKGFWVIFSLDFYGVGCILMENFFSYSIGIELDENLFGSIFNWGFSGSKQRVVPRPTVSRFLLIW